MLQIVLVVLFAFLTINFPASAEVIGSKKDLCVPDAAGEVQAPKPSAGSMEEAAVGDQWTYEVNDDITKTATGLVTHTVTDVTPTEISIRIEAAGKSGYAFQNFDHSWNMLSGGDWKYLPNDGTGIQSPLGAGKSWSFKSTDSLSPRGINFRRVGASIVTAVENVTTSAGTFATCKIQTSYSLRSVADPTKQIQASSVSWYAPEINHWVKRTSTLRLEGKVTSSSSIVLVEYNRTK